MTTAKMTITAMPRGGIEAVCVTGTQASMSDNLKDDFDPSLQRSMVVISDKGVITAVNDAAEGEAYALRLQHYCCSIGRADLPVSV
jgi:hypothetical protein